MSFKIKKLCLRLKLLQFKVFKQMNDLSGTSNLHQYNYVLEIDLRAHVIIDLGTNLIFQIYHILLGLSDTSCRWGLSE